MESTQSKRIKERTNPVYILTTERVMDKSRKPLRKRIDVESELPIQYKIDAKLGYALPPETYN